MQIMPLRKSAPEIWRPTCVPPAFSMQRRFLFYLRLQPEPVADKQLAEIVVTALGIKRTKKSNYYPKLRRKSINFVTDKTTFY